LGEPFEGIIKKSCSRIKKGGKKIRKVKVIDSLPGSGKTQWMIKYINELEAKTKVIYITPFLSETERIRDSCKKRKFKLPDNRLGNGSKLKHFKDLLRSKENISSTHALFSSIDDEVIELIEEGNYILVLDEVMSVVTALDVYKDEDALSNEERQYIIASDMQLLKKEGFINIDREYKVFWNEDKDVLSRYKSLKQLIDKEQVYFVSDAYLFWMFPHAIFNNIFKEVFLMTYQFDYQIQSFYFRFFEIPYEKFGVTKTRLDSRFKWEFTFCSYSDYLLYDLEKRSQMKELVTICDSVKLNSIGTKPNFSRDKKALLSRSDYRQKKSAGILDIQRKSISYLKMYLDDKMSTIMWTTFKDNRSQIKSTRFPDKHFVSLNARATNEHRDKSGLIYLVNRFVNPFFNNLFRSKKIEVNQDTYALAEMLQWIFRSCLRDDKPIKIFIPSERMRKLLTEWLDGKY